MGWTYTSQVDMTNGGADDQTSITIASGLSSGLTIIEVIYTLESTDAANQAMVLRLGDSGGFENANYECCVQKGGTYANYTDGFYNSDNANADAAGTFSGIYYLHRWDSSEHLWFCHGIHNETGNYHPRLMTGRKSLSGELTQLEATTSGGTAAFDGGEIRIRYR